MTMTGAIYDNILVPAGLLHGYCATPCTNPAGKGLVQTSIGWANGRFVPMADCAGLPRMDASGWTVLPKPVDCHVHLDKSFTLERTGLSDGSVAGAAALIGGHAVGWSQADYRARMTRAAEQAVAEGTAAMRTHIDTPGRAGTFPAWAAAQEVRAAFAGDLQIQIASLSALSRVTTPEFTDHCRDVATAGGVLGAFVPPVRVDPAMLEAFLIHADRHGLDVDFHIDENLSAGTANIETLARAILRTGYGGRVLAGHCCSLSAMAPDMLERTLDSIAASGMTIAALPHTNLYLQDRKVGHTPRQRGMTVIHELRGHAIPVALATDNVEDAFYPFGGYDLLDTYRMAATALHLDGDLGGWLRTITDTPAAAMGLADLGRIAPGQSARALLVKGTSWPRILAATADQRITLGSERLAPAHPQSDQYIGDPV